MTNIQLIILLGGFFIIQILTRTKIEIRDRPQNTRRLTRKSNSNFKYINDGQNRCKRSSESQRINSRLQ